MRWFLRRLLLGLAFVAALPAFALAQGIDRDSALFGVVVKSIRTDPRYARTGLQLRVDTIPTVSRAHPALRAVPRTMKLT